MGDKVLNTLTQSHDPGAFSGVLCGKGGVISWSDWLDLDALKVLSKHLSATGASILCFKALSVLINWSLPNNGLRFGVEIMEQLVLVILFLWFLLHMAGLLWSLRFWKNSSRMPP